MAVRTTSGPTRCENGPSAEQMSEHGLGRVAGWCYDHRRRAAPCLALEATLETVPQPGFAQPVVEAAE